MSEPDQLRRSDFSYVVAVPTRWSDNDMLGHLNNVIYNRLFESVVVRFMIEEAGVDWLADPVSPQVVETLCRFHRPLSFPDTVDAALRVEKVGNSSVTFALALFGPGFDQPAASGYFVDVFTDRADQKASPIPQAMRAVFESYR
jgi:acyl-CoA thioester hydrolase